MWFVVIRTAFELSFRLSAAHIRSVTTGAYGLSTASVRQREAQICHDGYAPNSEETANKFNQNGCGRGTRE